jgi:8-oxo-dGTP pyrophosphatase MutT (NUDIX family)
VGIAWWFDGTWGTLEEVAMRELFEETGLEARSLELFHIFSGKELYYKYPHGDEVYNVVCAYVCNDFAGDLKEFVSLFTFGVE